MCWVFLLRLHVNEITYMCYYLHLNLFMQVETVAQFGVIFLLFALGLEFSTTKVYALSFFFFEVFLFFCQHSGLNFIFHNCSFELLEQLLLWEVCFKFSYLCSCVRLQPWYVRFFLLNFGVNC